MKSLNHILKEKKEEKADKESLHYPSIHPSTTFKSHSKKKEEMGNKNMIQVEVMGNKNMIQGKGKNNRTKSSWSPYTDACMKQSCSLAGCQHGEGCEQPTGLAVLALKFATEPCPWPKAKPKTK